MAKEPAGAARIFQIRAEIITALRKRDTAEAKKGLSALRLELLKLKKETPFKKEQVRVLRELDKATKDLSASTKEQREETKASALAMINLRDAGSSMVILSDKMIQALDGLRETILDFDEASQQFLVLGEALDTAIGQQAIEAAERMAIQFAVSSDDVMTSMRDLAAMGIDASESVEFMEAALFAATAGMGEAGETGQTLLEIIRSFGMESSDATSVAAQLAFVANETNLNLQDMTSAMQFAGAQAGQMGLDLAEVAATMGIMRDAGLAASRVGTTMRQFLVRIQAPTGQARDLMDELGIAVTDADGNFLSIARVLRNVANATESMTQAQRGQVIATLFQTRGQQTFNLSMARGLDDLDNLIAATKTYEDTQAASNFLTQVSGDMLDNLGAQWRRVEEAERQAMRDIAENAIPIQIKLKQASVSLLQTLAKFPPELQEVGLFLMQNGAALLNVTGNLALTTTSIFTAAKAINKDFIPAIIRMTGLSKLSAATLTKLKFSILGVGLALGGAFLLLKALTAKSIEAKAVLSALTGVVLALAAAMFLKAAGLVASTAGIAAIGIAAGLATFMASISGIGAQIEGILPFQKGGFVKGKPGGTFGIIGERAGLDEVVSPVPMMKETFREVIREESGPLWSGNLIVQGNVLTEDDLKELIKKTVENSLTLGLIT